MVAYHHQLYLNRSSSWALGPRHYWDCHFPGHGFLEVGGLLAAPVHPSIVAAQLIPVMARPPVETSQELYPSVAPILQAMFLIQYLCRGGIQTKALSTQVWLNDNAIVWIPILPSPLFIPPPLKKKKKKKRKSLKN